MTISEQQQAIEEMAVKRTKLAQSRLNELSKSAWQVGRLQGRMIGAGISWVIIGSAMLIALLGSSGYIPIKPLIALVVMGLVLLVYGYSRERSYCRELSSDTRDRKTK